MLKKITQGPPTQYYTETPVMWNWQRHSHTGWPASQI